MLNQEPWLTSQAIGFLQEFLQSNPGIKILEFGSGGSTLWFAKKTGKLVSIEHDQRWYDAVKNQLILENLKNVDLRLIKSQYYNVCTEFPDEYFDLILVDGKDRIKCIEFCVNKLKKGGILMLDDAQRPQYKKIHSLLKHWKFFTTSEDDKETNWWIKMLKKH